MTFSIKGQEFEKEVIKSSIPVLVDFYATWCVPCKMISPSLEEISTEMKGVAKVVKMDIENSQEVVSRYNIKTVPTLLFFKNGVLLDQITGAASKNIIFDRMQSII